jgi:DNA-binding CsgD family transcriptional regulator
MGAKSDAERCATKLRTLGIRQASGGAVRRATTGWDSLTRAEVAVAKLVADGLTNAGIADRLFVSRHTIDTHMKHIRGKLHARSRVEIARAVHEAGDRDGAPRGSPRKSLELGE